MLAVGTKEGRVQLVNPETGETRFNLGAHTDVTTCVALSSDGSILASASRDGTLKVWDASNGVQLLGVKGTCFLTLDFSPCGKRLAAAGTGGDICEWDSQTAEEQKQLRGHARWVNAVSYLPDGMQLMSGGWDESVRIWDLKSGLCSWESEGAHVGGVLSVSCSRRGDHVASGGADGTAKVWKAQGTNSALLHTLLSHGSVVHSVAFSPSGQTLASGGGDKTIRVWQVDSGLQTICNRGHDGTHGCLCRRVDAGQRCSVLGHRGSVRSVAFSLDGRRIASSSGGGGCKVWLAKSGEHVRNLRTGPIVALAFGQDLSRNQKCEAFAMGQLQRLGAKSTVYDLEPGLMRLILLAV